MDEIGSKPTKIALNLLKCGDICHYDVTIDLIFETCGSHLLIVTPKTMLKKGLVTRDTIDERALSNITDMKEYGTKYSTCLCCW